MEIQLLKGYLAISDSVLDNVKNLRFHISRNKLKLTRRSKSRVVAYLKRICCESVAECVRRLNKIKNATGHRNPTPKLDRLFNKFVDFYDRLNVKNSSFRTRIFKQIEVSSRNDNLRFISSRCVIRLNGGSRTTELEETINREDDSCFDPVDFVLFWMIVLGTSIPVLTELAKNPPDLMERLNTMFNW